MLEEVGLHTMEHYIQVCRDTIATYIVHRLIFNTFKERERKRQSRRHQFLWDQPMELYTTRDIVEVKPDFGVGETALL